MPQPSSIPTSTDAATHQLSLRKDLSELLLVALGAVPGAVMRWQVGAHLHDNNVIVNVLGAFILGWLVGLPLRPKRQLLIGIGFCGSLTTFSSWMVDCVVFIAQGDWLAALGLIGMTLGLGLGAAALGVVAGRSLVRR
ncbi:CrcB family protein [Synechococcus sp. UW179B]|uniref:fluoride efflux transporter FluC n=1 Tax=Synechococcus sp. UW179B TaxID=2575516 RepID=UPI000E0FA18D|nr:CrcB family protein [Synechococcus sp. UW179B]